MSNKRGARFTGVVARFGANLAELAAQLETSNVHFVRCIKPNAQLQPRVFNEPKVEGQLRCNAVLTAIMIMKVRPLQTVTYRYVLTAIMIMKVHTVTYRYIPLRARPSHLQRGSIPAQCRHVTPSQCRHVTPAR